jgi:hypothetical protein
VRRGNFTQFGVLGLKAGGCPERQQFLASADSGVTQGSELFVGEGWLKSASTAQVNQT